jgi:hypothetical protein
MATFIYLQASDKFVKVFAAIGLYLSGSFQRSRDDCESLNSNSLTLFPTLFPFPFTKDEKEQEEEEEEEDEELL